MKNINHHRSGVARANKRANSPRTLGFGVLAIVSFLLASIVTNAAAETYQANEELRIAAKTFLDSKISAMQIGKNSEITIGHLDSRLRLTPCQESPTPFLSAGSKLQGKLTVGLRCSKPLPWTVYIPASIKNYEDVLVAAHALNKGSLISTSDIISVRRELSELRSGYYTTPDNIVGKELKRSISSGQVFLPNRLKSPLLVHRGDKVTIIAAMTGIKVMVKGEALKDAAYGERLPVRNSRSKRIIQAVATEPGIVEVAM